jgi:hypothetical protein
VAQLHGPAAEERDRASLSPAAQREAEAPGDVLDDVVDAPAVGRDVAGEPRCGQGGGAPLDLRRRPRVPQATGAQAPAQRRR